jgi:hypothetical protein
MAKPPFLIVGCPRSGTTILASEIQNRFEAGVADELNLELLNPVADKKEIFPAQARKIVTPVRF